MTVMWSAPQFWLNMQTSAFLSKSIISTLTGCGGSLLLLERWDAAEDVKPLMVTAVNHFPFHVVGRCSCHTHQTDLQQTGSRCHSSTLTGWLVSVSRTSVVFVCWNWGLILGLGWFNPAQSDGLQKIWNLSEKKTDVVSCVKCIFYCTSSFFCSEQFEKQTKKRDKNIDKYIW